MVKKNKEKEANVWLSLNKLHKNVIKEYIKAGEKEGVKRINFVFGNVDYTRVMFTIEL